VLGSKEYEMKDHLGNVRLVFSDRKTPADLTSYAPYTLEVRSLNNYYSFGSLQAGQSWESGSIIITKYNFRLLLIKQFGHKMNTITEQYIVDKKGKKTSVLIPFKEYQKILSDLEELEEIRAYDKAKAKNEELISFDDAIKMLNL